MPPKLTTFNPEKNNSETEISVILDGNRYPITKSGKGITPILLIGIGTLLKGTLDHALLNTFTMYCSDLYWLGDNSVENPSMDKLAEDLKSVAEQLIKPSEPMMLMAHSAFGPLAIHAAQKYPEAFSGVVMIGSPPGWNDKLIQDNRNFFDENADPERKHADDKLKNEYAAKNHADMSPSEKFIAEYLSDGARYWANPDHDASELWEGLLVNMEAINAYFDKTLPEYDITEPMKQLRRPVWLAAGKFDFDCCPIQRWGELPAPLKKHLTIAVFEESGHYPNSEEPKAFNAALMQWLIDNDLVNEKIHSSCCRLS